MWSRFLWTLALPVLTLTVSAPAWAVGPLRVGLMHSVNSVQVASSTAADVLDARGRALMRIAAMESWIATTDGANIQLAGPNAQTAALAGSLTLRPVASSGTPL